MTITQANRTIRAMRPAIPPAPEPVKPIPPFRVNGERVGIGRTRHDADSAVLKPPEQDLPAGAGTGLEITEREFELDVRLREPGARLHPENGEADVERVLVGTD